MYLFIHDFFIEVYLLKKVMYVFFKNTHIYIYIDNFQVFPKALENLKIIVKFVKENRIFCFSADDSISSNQTNRNI